MQGRLGEIGFHWARCTRQHARREDLAKFVASVNGAEAPPEWANNVASRNRLTGAWVPLFPHCPDAYRNL